ncbi:hypothetical protein FIBSPDRAFT_427675 [Athelia psychrophila]|uniref:Uncharacterized protein n=1 Tax=Athelia psychrophila TaxID=1759441 RepID=A0A166MTL6_9AGAM|nr:hypothetical protein FIBSPDRAFT_427675 [Fibularhizoctonia sp. CBS 109695]
MSFLLSFYSSLLGFGFRYLSVYHHQLLSRCEPLSAPGLRLRTPFDFDYLFHGDVDECNATDARTHELQISGPGYLVLLEFVGGNPHPQVSWPIPYQVPEQFEFQIGRTLRPNSAHIINLLIRQVSKSLAKVVFVLSLCGAAVRIRRRIA